VSTIYTTGRLNNYFIKPEYKGNDAAITNEDISGEHYWHEARVRLSLRYQYPVYISAKKVIARGGIGHVIDVGCGVATKLEMLHDAFPRVEFTGIDQPSTIEFCRRRYRFGRWVADDLESPSGDLLALKGDLVICADVIEHLGDPDILLEYLKARIRPGGVILLSTPERDALRGPSCISSPNKFHVREWNQSELRAYLRAAGFSIIWHELQLPVKAEFSRTFYTHVVQPALAGRPARWNQVCLLGVE
jgi:predicted TPR repeat methyltransferase